MLDYILVPIDPLGTLDLTALNARAFEGYTLITVVRRPEAAGQIAIMGRTLPQTPSLPAEGKTMKRGK